MNPNATHPLVQAAMNILQQNVAQPLQNGMQGFMHPQAPSGDTVQRALDQVPGLANIRGFSEGMFGQQAVNHPDVQPMLDSAMPSGVSYRPIASLISHEGAPDASRVAAYKALAASGEELPPLLVTKEQGGFGVEDGKHRLEAMRQLGHKFAPTIDMANASQATLQAYNKALDLAHNVMKGNYAR